MNKAMIKKSFYASSITSNLIKEVDEQVDILKNFIDQITFDTKDLDEKAYDVINKHFWEII